MCIFFPCVWLLSYFSKEIGSVDRQGLRMIDDKSVRDRQTTKRGFTTKLTPCLQGMKSPYYCLQAGEPGKLPT